MISSFTVLQSFLYFEKHTTTTYRHQQMVRVSSRAGQSWEKSYFTWLHINVAERFTGKWWPMQTIHQRNLHQNCLLFLLIRPFSPPKAKVLDWLTGILTEGLADSPPPSLEGNCLITWHPWRKCLAEDLHHQGRYTSEMMTNVSSYNQP